jgi:pyrroline-5-carboxylate reductase
MPLNSSVLLVGCGNMGSAMLNGWCNAGFSNISILDPQHNQSIDINSLQTFDVIILAIKPQLVSEILVTLQKFCTPQTIILSIMAGVTIESIKTLTNHNGAIFRSMPNTPAMISKGITAIIGNEKSTNADKQIIERLLNTLGKIIWINSESDMNIITAISGSGPAYVFYLTEILTNAAMKQGLSKDMAEILARETIIGSAYLMEEQSGLSAEQLRANVTSKGGTTEAALAILSRNDSLQDLFDDAIEAATNKFSS